MSDERPESFFDNPTLYAGTYLEFLGFRLIGWKEGYAKIEMPVRDDHRNSVGFLHGGVISSLLDIAGAVAGSYGVDKELVSVTVNLNCNYMAPHTADTVVAEGELVRTTTTMFFTEARLKDPDKNLLCATASGIYKRQPRG